MTLLYFAQARQLAGLPSETLPGSAPLRPEQLWEEILRLHPELAPLRPCTRLARNGRFADPETVFQPGDEIALIPPVSGG
jgi:molybdopterin converting factor small subunit